MKSHLTDQGVAKPILTFDCATQKQTQHVKDHLYMLRLIFNISEKTCTECKDNVSDTITGTCNPNMLYLISHVIVKGLIIRPNQNSSLLSLFNDLQYTFEGTSNYPRSVQAISELWHYFFIVD